MTSRRWLAVGAVTAALFLLAGRMLAALYVDYEWYAAMHALPIWRAQLFNTILLRGASVIVGGTFVFLNLLAVRRSVVQLVLPRRLGNFEIGEQVPGRYLMAAVIALSVLLGVLLTLTQQDWLALANVRYGDAFNATEGHQFLDYGFYVYWLPFESALYAWAVIALLVVSAAVIFLYALTPSLRWERGTLRVSTWVRRHLTVLGVCVLFLLAWSYRLDAYALVINGSGPEGAYTSIDKQINAPANIALALVTLSLSGVVLWAGWTRQLRLATGTAVTLFVLSIVLRHALPAIAPRLLSPRDPVARERTFVAERNQFGHYAFGLDRVRRADTGTVPPVVADPARDVAVWDPIAIERALDRSRRALRVGTEVGWEPGRDAVSAVVVTMPEAGDAAGPLAPWGAVRVRASHGGAIEGTFATVGAADPDVTHVVALPPVLVYDSASGPLIVNDSLVAGGVLRRGFVRIAHAWSQQNPRMLLADTPGPASRIVLRRDVHERVRALAPFLTQGHVVTPLLRSDSLYWAMDLYSATSNFPLSRHVFTAFGELGYLRHVAVALVHAYTGRVMLVKDAPTDALTEGWARHFPGLFTPVDSVPRELLDALPPPLELLDAVASQFASVGWRHEHTAPRKLALGGGGDTAVARGGPALFVVNDGGRRLAASVIVLDSADRMDGIMLATGGFPARIWWIPFSLPHVRWPDAADALLRAGEPLSPASVTPRFDRPIPGRVQAFPLAGTIWLLQPSYRWPVNGPPAVASVSLWRGGTAQAARDVASVLRNVRPGDVPEPVSGPASPARVAELYNRMRVALQRGDWAAFGAAFEALGRLTGQPAIR